MLLDHHLYKLSIINLFLSHYKSLFHILLHRYSICTSLIYIVLLMHRKNMNIIPIILYYLYIYTAFTIPVYKAIFIVTIWVLVKVCNAATFLLIQVHTTNRVQCPTAFTRCAILPLIPTPSYLFIYSLINYYTH